MFIDASAIVAIVTQEDSASQLAAALDDQTACITSSISVWEAAAAIARKTETSAHEELATVQTFLQSIRASTAPDSPNILRLAVLAFDRYGRRSGHLARLNLGDCFSSAFAKHHGVPLLYAGNDFAMTDVNDRWRSSPQ